MVLIRFVYGSATQALRLTALCIGVWCAYPATAAEPIMVLIDLHANPFFGTPTVQQQAFRDVLDAQRKEITAEERR